MDRRPAEITQLLLSWRNGKAAALDELLPIVEAELHRIALRFIRRQRPGNSLQATELVNEAFLRLVDSDKVNWQDRTHFFAVSAQLMRRVIVDMARKRNSRKRGGDRVQVTLADDARPENSAEADVVSLNEALERLTALSPRQGQIVELRYFGGLTEDQVAETLDISARTVRREWSLARAWLFRELSTR
jgi:RNA polymerase sigma factor (TIGR02999 family)